MPVRQGYRQPRLQPALGRSPYLESLNLEAAGVEVDQKAIAVDDYSRTSQPTILAIGDCTNRVPLTPVMVGDGVAENLQGLIPALKKGLTRAELMDTIGIHPTPGEEMFSL